MTREEIINPFLDHIGLTPFLAEDMVSEVMVSDGRVSVDRAGKLELVDTGTVLKERMLRSGVIVIARCLGDDIGPGKPWLRGRLPNGSRVAAMFPPASGNGITLTIRKFPRSYTAEDLVAMGSLPQKVYELLKETIAARENVLFSGGTTSGKTTMMGAAVGMIPVNERIVCIENPMELKLTQPHVVRFEVKAPTKISPGMSAEKLVQEALRHRPDRIVFGEVLGEEAFDLLQAMNSGHSGTFSTLHADSPVGALSRLAELAFPKFGDPHLARRAVANAIQYVIQVGRDRETGQRTVIEVAQVQGYDFSSGSFVTVLYEHF